MSATRFHVATTGPVLEHIAQAGELIEAAAFDDSDVFHSAYGIVATGELGVVRINPDAADALVSVHLTSDGTLTYGISDPKAGNGATGLQLQGDALVPVGARGFSTLAGTPAIGSDGANLYATVPNPIGDKPGFAVVCHGASCLTWKAPAPPPAGTGSCVTTSSNTLICTEWLGFSGGDDRDQKMNCQSSNGTLSSARCLTDNLVGGCQLARSDGSTLTNWYYRPTMGSIVKLLCMNQSKTFVPAP